ncbi:MAG: helix-turn-helix transcriptional regulator [Flavobacteriales bacterium]|nr:helix-turn-helix transcriptional regulator [Flavobacteriales bacterium]
MLSNEKFLQSLGRKIEKLYIEKYKNQSDFAAACEVDTRTIRRIIKAEQNPTILILRKIALALDFNLKDLIDIE